MNSSARPTVVPATSGFTRREFLKRSVFAGIAASLPACATRRVVGANGDIRVATIGFRSQGGSHISSLRSLKGVRYAALCDVDRKVLEAKAKDIGPVATYTDLRKLLENPEIDAVTIATPNHWHSLAAIWAIQAGKDVYVEKPVSHNVWEGRQLVKAAKKHGRIVQTGTQTRSSPGIAEAVRYVQSGELGRITVARGFCYKPRKSIGKTSGPQQVPENIDYELWTGPADLVPPHRNGKFGPVHYDWHWFWNYGGGDLGNQGIHQMDICRWFLNEQELAPAVLSAGGRFGYEDDGETPNTFIVLQNYKRAPLIFEVRGLPKDKKFQGEGWEDNMDKYKGAKVGCVIECEGGHVLVSSYTRATAFDRDGKQIRTFGPSEDDKVSQPGLNAEASGHHQNFIDAVRSQDSRKLNAPILGGHLSSALCHTGNISYRLGAKLAPGAVREKLQDQRGLGEAFDRMATHLAANGVDVEKDQVKLGLPLAFDPKVERFLGNADADALLKRVGRAPFTVPETV